MGVMDCHCTGSVASTQERAATRLAAGDWPLVAVVPLPFPTRTVSKRRRGQAGRGVVAVWAFSGQRPAASLVVPGVIGVVMVMDCHCTGSVASTQERAATRLAAGDWPLVAVVPLPFPTRTVSKRRRGQAGRGVVAVWASSGQRSAASLVVPGVIGVVMGVMDCHCTGSVASTQERAATRLAAGDWPLVAVVPLPFRHCCDVVATLAT